MIRIHQLKLPIEHSEAQLAEKIQKTLKVNKNQIISYKIAKRSIDARKKPELFYVYSVDVETENETTILNRTKNVNHNIIMLTNNKEYPFPDSGTEPLRNRPVIIGFGPAGMFAAYLLACAGYQPVIIERGRKVEERTKDVDRFWKTGHLEASSNVQFGEGGAGTFSDGKLNTLVNDPVGRNRFVLETFVKYGAPEHILYESKPHIGTDILRNVIPVMRNEIRNMGGTFHFESCVTDFRIADGKIASVSVLHKGKSTWLDTKVCILAIGHSARDTFSMLLEKKLFLEPKSFAVGFRVEHPQSQIDLAQYGERYAGILPAASYRMAANLKNGRSVYSFCMCPGGYVVNASSEEGRLAVNGMSYSKRDGKNANSAIIVSVTPKDFDGMDALAGVRFQQNLEEKAFQLAAGKIPQQMFDDYCKNQVSTQYGTFFSQTCGEAALCNLRGLLPEELEESFIEGMRQFSHTIKNFDQRNVILSGVESRTSSPVRITRDETFESNIRGIYPCGEGAGYAGGIMSAAMDGLKTAEAIIKRFEKIQG